MDDIVATRRLDRAGSPVVVDVFRPEPFAPDGDDFRCGYRISGLGPTAIHAHAAGIDAVQALLLALTRIGELLGSDEGDLTFLGMRSLGFPRFEADVEDPDRLRIVLAEAAWPDAEPAPVAARADDRRR